MRRKTRPTLRRIAVLDDEADIGRIVRLAESFPCLGRFDLWPWDPVSLSRRCEGASHGEKVTIQFILTVWNQYESWGCGRFDVMEALAVWDPDHRAAFLKWATDPWWA
jgi:hypothetical protein